MAVKAAAGGTIKISTKVEETVLDSFGLKEQPFASSPNPRYLYVSDHHKAVLGKTIYGITGRQGLLSITGGFGEGKTTIARHLLAMFMDEPEGYTIRYLVNPKFSTDVQLLRAICAEFGVEMKRSKQEQLAALLEYLTEQYTQNKNVILLLDEAQLLIGAQFELIKQMLNFETSTEKLIQVVLFATHDIWLKLAHKKQVLSRIYVKSMLDSFGEKELRDMIAFRTSVAGSKRDLLTDGAYDELYRYSQGSPRTALKACYNALPIAYFSKSDEITIEHIMEAERELREEEARKIKEEEVRKDG